MSFLSGLDGAAPGQPYAALGYSQNPFPVRGQVFPEVYLPRDELREMQQTLVRFLQQFGVGRLWAVEGEAGLGKTNILAHLDWDLSIRRKHGQLATMRHLRLASQQVAPRTLAQLLVQAIGEASFSALVASPSLLPMPEQLRGSDLDRFFSSSARRTEGQAAAFLMRWLGGHQTYASERSLYNISARERLAPSVGFVYLRYVLDALASAQLVERLVLLLDEFEDIQALTQVESEYAMALKGLVNAFNWERLFVVVAGTEGAFTSLGQKYPSLQTRWTRVRLLGVTTGESATRLASTYKDHFHREFNRTTGSSLQKRLLPDDERVKLTFLTLMEKRAGRLHVSQRDLLHALHDWIETNIEATGSGA